MPDVKKRLAEQRAQSQQVTTRVTPEIHARLKEKSEQTGIPMSHILRQCLLRWLEED